MMSINRDKYRLITDYMKIFIALEIIEYKDLVLLRNDMIGMSFR